MSLRNDSVPDQKTHTDSAPKQQTKILSGRPKKYTASDAFRSTLYSLFRQFAYQGQIDTKLAGYPITTAGQQFDVAYKGYRFKRDDGQIINYFPTIKDSDGIIDTLPTLQAWLTEYKELVAQRKMDPTDITILPIVLVQNGRRHFNTLALHHDGKVQHAYIIEPRSTNLTSSLKQYPVETTLFNDIKKSLSEAADIQNIKIGKQKLHDDTTCGAHHVNFAEILSALKSEYFTNIKLLKSVLRRARLSRRDDDTKRKNSIDINLLQTQNETQPEAKGPMIATASTSSNENDNSNTEDAIIVDEIVDEIVDGFAVESRDKNNSPGSDPANNALQMATLQDSKRQSDALKDAARNDIVIDIQNYAAQRTPQIKLFDVLHTRRETAKQLAGILAKLNANGANEEDAQINRMKTVLLLYAFRESIHNFKSDLRDIIDKKLAVLLDCQLEHDKIINKHIPNNIKFNSLHSLFHDRISLFILSNSKDANTARYNIGCIRSLTLFFKDIDKVDTGYQLYNKEKKDSMRESNFLIVRGILEKMSDKDVNRRVSP